MANTWGFTTGLMNQMLELVGAWWVQLHTDDPGSSGTANISSTTARVQVMWNPASAGSKVASNAPSWGTWAGANGEVITHISLWDGAVAGSFQLSVALGVNQVTANTNAPVTLTGLTLTMGPLA